MEIREIRKSNFEQDVLRADKPVLLDFFAKWCMPCKMLSPIVSQINEENENLVVYKVDIDQEPELAAQFKVMSIPTLVYLKDGNVKDQMVGFRNKETIQRMLKD